MLEPWRTGVWSPTEKPPSYIILVCHPMGTRSGWQQSSPMSSLTWYHTKFSGVLPSKNLVSYLNNNNCVPLWNVFKNMPIKWHSVLSVVWELGDHKVVEWLVAQWGLCHLRVLSWRWLCWAYVEYGEFLFSGGHFLYKCIQAENSSTEYTELTSF